MIENLLQYIKVNILETNTLIQSVYDYERADSEGTPFATITPSGNENDYHSTSENGRVYSFLVRLFIDRGGQTNSATSEKAMRGLVDSVLDDFDKNFRLNGITVPTGYLFSHVSAVPSQWGYVGREMNYRVAEIVVKCHVFVDVTNIS